MREIKFRAWNKNKKIMVYEDEDNSSDYLDGWIASDVQVLNQTLNSEWVLKKYEFMQYIGLHDKNGKEIYEGDIVKFEDIGEDGYEYKEGFDFENEAQVIYEDGQVTLTNFGEGENSHYANNGQPDILDEILRNGNCEVIGNIYDNPELLEGKEE